MPKGEVVPVPILCTVVFGAPIALAPGEERRAFLDRARAAGDGACATSCLMGEPARAQRQPAGRPAVRRPVRPARARRRSSPSAARCASSRPSRRRCASASRASCARSGSARSLFWIAWASGPLGSTLLFGFVSFFALREFVTLTHTRRADHRALLLAFFVVLPMQYVLVGMRLFNAFTVFIPVYVFFAIPVISALANDPFRFLERTAKIQWGITVCVYGMSHAPALLLLDLPRLPRARRVPGPLPGRRRRRRAARPGGREPAPAPPAGRARDQPLVLVARVRRRRRRGRGSSALLLYWMTPFKPLAALAMGAIAGARRHARRVRDEGAQARRRRAQLARRPSVTGAVGLLDRVAPLCFAAPVFFHSVRWLFRHLSGRRGRDRAGFGSNGVMRVLGIDPGLRTTGFGVVECDGGRARATSPAARSAPTRSRSATCPARLKVIFDGVREIAARYAPTCASVEIVFVNVNPQATLLLGQARGAALSALVAARARGRRIHRAADEAGDRRPRPGEEGTSATDGDAPARPARRCPARTPPTRSAWRSATPTPPAASPRSPAARRCAPRTSGRYKSGRTY